MQPSWGPDARPTQRSAEDTVRPASKHPGHGGSQPPSLDHHRLRWNALAAAIVCARFEPQFHHVALVRMDRAHTRGNPAKRRSGNRDYGGCGREIKRGGCVLQGQDEVAGAGRGPEEATAPATLPSCCPSRTSRLAKNSGVRAAAPWRGAGK